MAASSGQRRPRRVAAPRPSPPRPPRASPPELIGVTAARAGAAAPCGGISCLSRCLQPRVSAGLAAPPPSLCPALWSLPRGWACACARLASASARGAGPTRGPGRRSPPRTRGCRGWSPGPRRARPACVRSRKAALRGGCWRGPLLFFLIKVNLTGCLGRAAQ